ncbi:MAG TPA: hypothetical protein VFT34_09670, partial [Verrucomicrobiae bacterium]|nr:hypothetical protein [Verrucomicrobiae bacterium]
MSITSGVKIIGFSKNVAPGAAAGSPELSRMGGAGTRLVRLLALGLVLLGTAGAQAAVSITAATGGTNISADTAQNAASPSFTTLGNIVMTETVANDFSATGTLILTAPSGWRFNTSATITATGAKDSGSGGNELTAIVTSLTASNLTINIIVGGTAQINHLTISGLQVQATNGAAVPSSGNIYRATGNPGTATINGITTTSNGSGSGGSNFGSLSQVAGAVVKLGITTQPGSATAGAVFGVQPVVKTQDQFGNNSTNGLGAIVNVAVSLTSGTGLLQGTTTLNIGTTGGNGTVSYTNLRIDAAGASKQLTAAAAGLTSALSSTFTVNAATASQLVFVQQPSNATAGTTIAPAVTVQLRDAFGNSVPNAGVSVAMTLSSGTGSLSGMTSHTTDGTGSATFGDLSINLAGSKNLTASSVGLTPAVSSSFTVSAAAPVQLVFSQQPTDAAAGATLSPAIKVHVADGLGNDVPGVMVTLSLNGSGTLSGTSSQSTDSSGVATFGNLSVNLAGSKSLTAATGPAIPVESSAFTISPAAASQVVFVQQPTDATAGVVIAPAVTAQLKDALGNNVVNFGVTVTMALTTGSGALGGTLSRTTDAAGLATFDDLSISLSGSKKLTVSSSGLSSAESSAFAISPAAASQLAFIQQPTNTTAGQAISPAVTVQVTDPFGNSVPVAGVSMEMSLSSGTGALSGTTTRTTDSAGLAVFNDLGLIQAGAKKLTATNSALGSVESDTFMILAAPPSQLVFVQQPSAATAGAPITPAVKVHVADSFGNDAAGAAVTLSLNGTGTLSGTTAQSTDGSGVATFADLSINLAGSKTLTATSGAATPMGSDPFAISPAGASQLAVVQQPTNATAGAVIAPPVTVQVQDSFGNNLPNGGVAIAMALATGMGTLSGTTSRNTDATGLAAFDNLSINLSGSKNLTASSAGLSSALSSAFTISPAAASQLAFAQQPSDAAAGAAITPAVQVHVTDSFGNGVPGVLVAMSLSSGTGTLSGTAARTSDSAGLATFNDLSIDLSGPKKLTSLSGFLTPVDSNPFTISPAAPSQLVIQTQPSATATAGVVFAQQPVLRIEDAFGNHVTSDNTTVVTAARAAGSGTLQGTVSATAVAGVATFTNLSHNVATTITVGFTSGSLTGATSESVVVTAGPFAKLQLLVPSETATPGSPVGKTGTPATQTAGMPFNATVNAVDAYWNPIDTVTDSVAISSSDPNAVLPGNAALVGGTQSFSIVLRTAGSATV